MDLKGRNFLTLKDFTPEEITYMLDLAAISRIRRKKGIPVDKYRGMNVALILRRQVQEHVVHSKWQRMIWEWEQLILIRQDHDRQERKYCRYRKSSRKNV